jgi:selenocysteine lyase/cysteine desulfurase
MIIPNQKSLFNIPDDITYMNCANMSPLLKSANEAGVAAINQRNSPWTILPGQWFEPAEELRVMFAKMINSDKENVALIPSASYGLAIAKKNIQLTHSQSIVVLDQEFPSNMYVWRELSKETGAKIITIKRIDAQTWTEAILNKIDDKTGLVAIPNCHWTDGSIIDLGQVGNKIRKTSAKFVIDASQSLGVYPIDINKIKPDFLVTVGYKWLLGPYGLGYLYSDEKYFDLGKPIEYNWINKNGSEDFTRLVDYTDIYKPGARRFDAGEFSSFIHLPMAKAALTQILKWGIENIQETLSMLTNQIAAKAKEHGFEIPEDRSRVGHMIGIKFSENKAKEIGRKLIDNKIYISFRGASMRIAPHLYNDSKDVNRLFQSL